MIIFATPISKIIVFLINVIGITLIINVVLSNSVKKIVKMIFSTMSFLMFIWVDLAFLARIIEGNNNSVLFIRIAWSVTPMLFVLVYYFLIQYLNNFKGKIVLTSILLGLGGFFNIITLFSNTVISSTEFAGKVLIIHYGIFVWAFFGFVAILTMINFLILIKAYKKLKDDLEMRIRIRFLIIGLTIFFIANAVFNIFFPVFLGNFQVYEFGDYSLIIFMTIIAYALIRHRMFGVKVILALFVVVFLGAFLLLDTIFFTQDWIQRMTKLVIFGLYLPVGYLLVRSVINEIKQKEELQVLTEKLKKMDLMKNEFINMAAHELRAPLTAIKGFVSMILEGDTGEINPKTQEFLEDSKLSTDRMIRLVNNMLDVSRIEEGRIVYQDNNINLNEVVKSASSEFELEAKRKGLDFKVEVADGLSDYVFVDRDRIHEVVVNYLSNAIKYTEKGSVIVKIFNPADQVIRVEVIDSGMGIGKVEQQKLFSKFYRVEASAGKTIGTGLGLYISKLLIEHYGGKIGVESEYGEGSKFWFELPVRPKK